MSDWESFDNKDEEEESASDAESGSEGNPNGLKAEDFLKEPEVNYVRSSETLINVGDDIGLTNKDPTLKNLLIGCGWDVKTVEGTPPDLDISCFLLNKDDMTRIDEDFVFYNNEKSKEGEVDHKGDSRTGAGEGDNENIEVNLQALSFEVLKVSFVLSIHEGIFHEQNFSMVRNTFFRILNAETMEELCRLDLNEEVMERIKGTAMIVGYLFRDGPKWRFHATCEDVEEDGLAGIARTYGLLVP